MKSRRGTIIAAALALMLLAAGLLASAALVSSVRAESAARARLSLVAESEGRRVLARLVAGDDPAIDLLDVGGAFDRTIELDARDRSAELAATALVRVQRLSAVTYALAVDVRAGSGIAARRRFLVIVRRPDAGVESASRALVPITRWSMADLY